MSEPEPHPHEVAFQKISPSKRVWVLPMLRVIEKLGGAAAPKDVKHEVLELFEDHLNEAQRAYVLQNNRIGWTRLDMAGAGLLTGKHGTWELTPMSRRFLKAHQDEPLMPPENVPEGPSEKILTPSEVVKASDYRLYDLPILKCLEAGITARQDILSKVGEELKDQLLPGDLRRMPSGYFVYSYRASWALYRMSQKGYVRNSSWGVWEITEKGRELLAREGNSFRAKDFQGTSKATVLLSEVEPLGEPKSEDDPDRMPKMLGVTLAEELSLRLQLGRGSSPVDASGLTRNLVFYGPPGTGKTHLAKRLATALTGEDTPSKEGRWRLVQFHPSYAYEDFIQGLRPNLEETQLSYTVSTGPFLEMCQSASNDPDNYYVLVIDEINRGDPARIFGELLYALEYRGEEIELPLGGLPLSVPANLILLGTMNSVDRSVALVDYALRRRFGFVRVDPNPEVIMETVSGNAALAAEVLGKFNEWLTKALDKEHAVGHSYFLNPSYHPFSASSLERIWTLDIEPLLEEYFYGHTEQMREARRQWDRAVDAVSDIVDEDDQQNA